MACSVSRKIRDCLLLIGLLGQLLLTQAGCDLRSRSQPDLVWGVHGVKPGHLYKPSAAAFDAQDNLFLADLTDRIQVFDRDGKYLRGWRTPQFNVDGPSGLDRRSLWPIAGGRHPLLSRACLLRDGQILFQIGDGVQGTTPGRFGYPTDVVIDRAGNFYVAEYGENDRIQVFSPEGKWLRQWGGHGYEPGEFLKPRALAIDEHDRLFVADSCNHRIQVFDTQGKLLNSWGSRGDPPGQMSYPYDLAIGRDGCLYVCEYGNHRVQKFTLDGKPLAVWGTAGRGPGQLFQPLRPGGRQPVQCLGRRLEQPSRSAFPALRPAKEGSRDDAGQLVDLGRQPLVADPDSAGTPSAGLDELSQPGRAGDRPPGTGDPVPDRGDHLDRAGPGRVAVGAAHRSPGDDLFARRVQ